MDRLPEANEDENLEDAQSGEHPCDRAAASDREREPGDPEERDLIDLLGEHGARRTKPTSAVPATSGYTEHEGRNQAAPDRPPDFALRERHATQHDHADSTKQRSEFHQRTRHTKHDHEGEQGDGSTRREHECRSEEPAHLLTEEEETDHHRPVHSLRNGPTLQHQVLHRRRDRSAGTERGGIPPSRRVQPEPHERAMADHSTLRIDNALLLTMAGGSADPIGARRASLRVRAGRIVALGDLTPEPGEASHDANGMVITPGFVQGHVHFCQTLFRGLADDKALMPWLATRIWPLEAAHDANSVRASTWLSLAELLRGGTTCVQVMESVRHAEKAFEALRGLGMVGIVGNCLMDLGGPDVPANLPTSTAGALRIADDLRRAFHRPEQGLHYAVSPRFVLSCSDELAAGASDLAARHGLRIHTHANEHPGEVAAVHARFRREYLQVLEDQGLLGPRTALAHCVHTSERERERLVANGCAVLHCPSANLKLGSGIAPIADYARRGLRIALGADGAPCNNRLSALTEMRQAALLQGCTAGPGAWPATLALHAATRGGALALGLDADVGSLEVGKRADLVVFDLRSLAPGGDPVAMLVWSADERNVRHVLLGGRFVVRDFELVEFDAAEVAATAMYEREQLLARAGDLG